MQFVQIFQVSDCSDLQEIETVLASVTKIGDVAVEGGTRAIVLADTAVEQQVVAPGERTRSFCGLRRHWAPPKSQRKTHKPFRSANFSGVMLFRSCAARWCCGRRRHDANRSRGWLFPRGTAPGREQGRSLGTQMTFGCSLSK